MEARMIELTNFEVQNWLVTPAALAFNERPPRTAYEQKWILVLTGSVDARLVGNDSGTMDNEVHIVPDLIGPCHYAINHYGILRPPGVDEGANYNVEFQVDLWAPYAGLANTAVTSGILGGAAIFGVPGWKLSHFKTGVDCFTNAPINNIFSGLIVTCDAWDDVGIWGVRYHVTLAGKIVFTQILIT
jgi:hypothetical protein